MSLSVRVLDALGNWRMESIGDWKLDTFSSHRIGGDICEAWRNCTEMADSTLEVGLALEVGLTLRAAWTWGWLIPEGWLGPGKWLGHGVWLGPVWWLRSGGGDWITRTAGFWIVVEH